MNDDLALDEIRMAKEGVAEAEDDLAKLMKDIEVAPRAAKTTINEAVHAALQTLRHAREHLGKLETLIRGKGTRTADSPDGAHTPACEEQTTEDPCPND